MPKFGEIEINFSYEKVIRDLCCEAGRRITIREMAAMGQKKLENWLLFSRYLPFNSPQSNYVLQRLKQMHYVKGAIMRLMSDPEDEMARSLLKEYVSKLDTEQKRTFAQDFYNYPSFGHLRLEFLPYPYKDLWR